MERIYEDAVKDIKAAIFDIVDSEKKTTLSLKKKIENEENSEELQATLDEKTSKLEAILANVDIIINDIEVLENINFENNLKTNELVDKIEEVKDMEEQASVGEADNEIDSEEKEEDNEVEDIESKLIPDEEDSEEKDENNEVEETEDKVEEETDEIEEETDEEENETEDTVEEETESEETDEIEEEPEEETESEDTIEEETDESEIEETDESEDEIEEENETEETDEIEEETEDTVEETDNSEIEETDESEDEIEEETEDTVEEGTEVTVDESEQSEETNEEETAEVNDQPVLTVPVVDNANTNNEERLAFNKYDKTAPRAIMIIEEQQSKLRKSLPSQQEKMKASGLFNDYNYENSTANTIEGNVINKNIEEELNFASLEGLSPDRQIEDLTVKLNIYNNEGEVEKATAVQQKINEIKEQMTTTVEEDEGHTKVMKAA